MIFGPRCEPNHSLMEYLNEYCLYQDGDEDVICVECGQCKEAQEWADKNQSDSTGQTLARVYSRKTL
jgi:hypothetical protein